MIAGKNWAHNSVPTICNDYETLQQSNLRQLFEREREKEKECVCTTAYKGGTKSHTHIMNQQINS